VIEKMSWTQVEVRELKAGRYMVIDNEPCKIMSIQTSKPGKHGEAKARIEAIGIFDGAKRSIVHPVKHRVIVPIIDKRTAQVISINPSTNEVQLMDLKTYEVFSVPMDEELKEQVVPGKEIQYIIAMDKRKITRI
jgi:translation initiation factor 5A